MSESVLSFQSLPSDYRELIELVEARHGLAISPLQQLGGGRSGALLYLVRVASTGSDDLEHLILKLDRKRPKASADEVTRHRAVLEKSPPAFAQSHIPEIKFEPVEANGALAMLYTIAGQSLRSFRTLSSYRQQSQLERLFAVTYHYLLEEWNSDRQFEAATHPRELLADWLGFRLNEGQRIESFLGEVCRLPPEVPGFLVRGELLPNPLHYARKAEIWGSPRPLDVAHGLQHSDLNTNNILAMFSGPEDRLTGYYLIDFALFKAGKPLLYDQRYLEMSYLIHATGNSSPGSVIDLIARYAEHEILPPEAAPIEVAGVNGVVRAGRQAFRRWVEEEHPSLQDDLWGQYWLAGAAAGLAFCHKGALDEQMRLAGLIYGAANLKQYLQLFGLPVPSEAGQLYPHDQGDRISTGLARRAGPAESNLPTPLTAFVGRTSELAELTERLRRPEVRLVTITGAGGTGKTRLGLELGRALLEDFADGVHFIDLAQISDPSMVASTTAHTLGLREGGSRPSLARLTEYLVDKELLLIFDNFEQLVAAADTIAQLLAAAPGVKALITSRVPLHVQGEHEYPLSPLQTPPQGERPLEELLGIEAVSLFRQQARAASPQFEITDENREVVVEICRRLDGLPLAIEIAAARIKMLPPQALLKRLDQSLEVLIGGPRDRPERQRTLRQTINWSYQLLATEEQALFVRLGVFAGGFSLAAAEEIYTPEDGVAVFTGVETLLDNSLLRQVPSVDDEPRFDMLLTVRDFAQEKAAEAGLWTGMRWSHFHYYCSLAAGGMGEKIFGSDSIYWLQRYEEEHDNLRLALDWGLQQPEEGLGPVLEMLPQLSWFWFRHGHLLEGNDWAQQILVATEQIGPSRLRAMALGMRGTLAMWAGDLLVAEKCSRESVEMGRSMNLIEVVSIAQMTYGITLINQGKDREAYPHLVDVVELLDEQEQPWTKGTALVHLANISLGMGDVEQTRQWLEAAMPLMNSSGDVWSMAFALNNYGELARVQGDYGAAEDYYRRTEALFEQADAKGDQARLVHNLAYIAQHKGDLEEAEHLFKESLNQFRGLGNSRGIAECLAGLANLAVVRGNHSWGARLLSAAEAHLHSVGGAWWPADRVEIERAKERLKVELGDQFDSHWQRGRSLGVEEAIALALNGVEQG